MSTTTRGIRVGLLAALLTLGTMMALLPCPASARLPDVCDDLLKDFKARQEAASEDTSSVQTGTMAISLLNEIEMGDDNAKTVEKSLSLLPSEQVQRVAAKLIPFADRPVLTYRAQVLGKTEELNAFSLPGGRIYITNALLEALEPTDGELAFIVGHELAHAALRHIPSYVEASYGDYWGRLQICAAAKAGKVDDDAVVPAFQTLDLTRSFTNAAREFEADQFGALYAVQAGYAMADAFSALKKVRKLLGDNSDFGTAGGSFGDHLAGSILSLPTHPAISDRLEQLNRFAAQLQTVADNADAAIQMLSNREYQAASDAFAAAVKFFPQSRSLRMNLALANHLRYRASAPREDMPLGLLSTPEKLEVEFRRLVTRAAELPDTTALNRAVAGYKQILAQDSEHYLARNNLAVAYLDLHKTDLAIAELEKALTVPSNYLVAQRNLTLACLDKLLAMGEGAAAMPDGATLVRKADRTWTAYKDLRGSLLNAEDAKIGQMVEAWKQRL